MDDRMIGFEDPQVYETVLGADYYTLSYCSDCRKYMITGVIELLRVVGPVSELDMAAV